MPKSSRLLGFLLVSFYLSSCVQTKNLIYLQEKENTIVSDSIVHTPAKSTEYILSPGSKVSINIYTITPNELNFLSDYNSGASIENSAISGHVLDNEGSLSLPVVGKVNLNGLTINQAEDKLNDTLKHYIESPTVKIEPLDFYITILGEVSRPGRYQTFNKSLTILEAIGIANDLTDFANREKIQITRTQDGITKTFTIDVTDANVLTSKLLYLKKGDLIIVPPLKVKVFKRYNAQNLSLTLSTLSLIAIIINISIR